MRLHTPRPLQERWMILPLAAALAVALVGLVALLAAGAACGNSDSDNTGGTSHLNPALLSAVDQARELGISPYWLGSHFRAGASSFSVTAAARVFNEESDPHLYVQYAAATEDGLVDLRIVSYPKGAWTAQELAERSAARANPEHILETAEVGPWAGILSTFSTPSRPVTNLQLFVDVRDVVVIAQAGSGINGIPGSDPNPLIDAELLIEVVAEHLRPYPQ